jgi:hypothetical protein
MINEPIKHYVRCVRWRVTAAANVKLTFIISFFFSVYVFFFSRTIIIYFFLSIHPVARVSPLAYIYAVQSDQRMTWAF